jgi:hypothetical protein
MKETTANGFKDVEERRIHAAKAREAKLKVYFDVTKPVIGITAVNEAKAA